MTETVRKALELAAKSSYGFQAIPHEVSEAAKKALAALEAKPSHVAPGMKSIHFGPPLTDEEMIAITSGDVKPEDHGMRQIYPAKPAASQDAVEAVARALTGYPETPIEYIPEGIWQWGQEKARSAITAYTQFLEEGTEGSGNAPVSSSANAGGQPERYEAGASALVGASPVELGDALNTSPPAQDEGLVVTSVSLHADGSTPIACLERPSEISANRADFEKALLLAHPGTPLGMINGLYDENCVQGAWRGWNLRKSEQASVSPKMTREQAENFASLPSGSVEVVKSGQPNGWTLVPNLITEEMQHAYFEIVDKLLFDVEWSRTNGRYSNQKLAYAAMLGAAPLPLMWESGKPCIRRTGNLKVTPDATIQPTGIVHGEGRIGDEEKL